MLEYVYIYIYDSIYFIPIYDLMLYFKKKNTRVLLPWYNWVEGAFTMVI